ncbi:SAM-dependent methyltransferase [Bdellovibrio sp. NC01]|uniref:SAM-dependent methyltransferase n=1 Tax=Bdellovibrio sp. NC01 TaxID=2220073 RepID=UPI001159550A|nr:SAM-dependent methyltransferase [Bdellovibrio sp. NC01]QDK36721.1 SAM-dependent methyltransferase [Bdellovibrio sp. NC01]
MNLIFDYLIPGEPVWDFCCDHGYMGLKAYHSCQFPEVHFVDQVPHIIARLEQSFLTKHQKAEYTQKVFFWAQSGENINSPLNGTAIIAGVGAHTILQILRGLFAQNTMNASRFILAPQKQEEFLEQELSAWNEFQTRFKIADVTHIQEGSRHRKLLIFDKVL